MNSPAPAIQPVPSPAVPGSRAAGRRWLVRRRCWLLLLAAVFVCLPFYPPVWQASLRTWLVWQAHRHGCDLSVTCVEGGVFDTTQLLGLRLRQRGLSPADGDAGTDLSIARAELTLDWVVPWFQQPAPSWVRSLVLEGVRGRCDLGALGLARALPLLAAPRLDRGGPAPAAVSGHGFAHALGSVFPPLGGLSARFVPESFLVHADDLRLRRGRYRLRAVRLRLSGSRDEAGQFLAREVDIAGPGFENTLLGTHGETYWKGSRLTLTGLSLADGVTQASATLDGTHLDRRRLDWECRLTALGGDLHGQGTIDFSGDRLGLEVAASLRGAEIGSLARLLGSSVPADGRIDQGNFTFRGDPENWPAAQMWLAAHATDFRWDKRRWQDLELQAVIVNRRVQVHRLELRQSRNRVSLTGECPLPPVPAGDRTAADALRQWRQGGFSCQVDARLEDLRSLADLFGPGAPEMDGRMSVNGALGAPPGVRQDIDGYLNVEGSRLVLRGVPLDFLRSTLLFRGGELRVADLQATHGSDYFTGSGSMRLDGPPHHGGDLRAEVGTLADYTPALADWLPLADPLSRVTHLSALLRWEDGVLHFDDFRGEFDGALCQIGGTVDLHDAARPALDLSLDGEHVTLRSADGQSEVQADCALTVRSAAGGPSRLGGDVRVLGGSLAAALETVPAAGAAGDFLSYAQWLPDRCRLCALDLRVTASGPLRLRGGGEITPELHLCPLPMPGLSAGPGIPAQTDDGRLELRDVPLQTSAGELRAARGAIYFPFGINGPVETSLLADGPNGERVALYGYWNLVQTAAVGGEAAPRAPVNTAADDWSALHPASLPPLRMVDATPWTELVDPPPLGPPPPVLGDRLRLR